MRTRYDVDLPLAAVLAGLGSMILVSFLMIMHLDALEDAERARLMQQCLDDGKKEYECQGLLARGQSTTFIPLPIIIPSGR